jgi:hypothetical protein
MPLHKEPLVIKQALHFALGKTAWMAKRNKKQSYKLLLEMSIVQYFWSAGLFVP